MRSRKGAEPPGQNSADVAWPLADAKARFSELIDTAEREGPQVITKHGREVAVLVPIEEWRQKANRSGSFAQFMAESPLRGADLTIERIDADARDVEL
ncbi:type II toxin-antitoxin system Phd/YefM family antitoxin [Nocardia lijiangensis]|uniref:type II toxin-antitoxin system Phd/YefM family antitoxin n=1 Tax=Nocardia lijiangensis TaxID=299618 RepID=UPI000ABFB27B|nr:type II toxin-antitoxin system Phd/YefM family antitoxin [Nocardia lijiangensis]